jgi:hypothetical protein
VEQRFYFTGLYAKFLGKHNRQLPSTIGNDFDEELEITQRVAAQFMGIINEQGNRLPAFSPISIHTPKCAETRCFEV